MSVVYKSQLLLGNWLNRWPGLAVRSFTVGMKEVNRNSHILNSISALGPYYICSIPQYILSAPSKSTVTDIRAVLFVGYKYTDTQ